MRHTEKLSAALRKAKISYSIFELDGGCLGIAHSDKHRGKVAAIVEHTGYTFILPHEYEYSFKKKPIGDTIIY